MIGNGTYEAGRTDFYSESLFGEGWSSPQSYVVIFNEWFNKLPPDDARERHITDMNVPREDRSVKSRLGIEIVLQKELDGLVVAVRRSHLLRSTSMSSSMTRETKSRTMMRISVNKRVERRRKSRRSW